MLKTELLEIIENQENSWVEFKRDDIRSEQLAKEIVAMLNFEGGRVLLGVEDDGTITGLQRENTEERVINIARDKIHPPVLPAYEQVKIKDNLFVGVIAFDRGVSKPYMLKHNNSQDVFIRRGSISDPATREEQARLYQEGSMMHAEVMPVPKTNFDSLDLARLQNYLQDILNDSGVPKTKKDWITRLKNLNFMTDGIQDKPVCTIAGLVLFGINPRRMLRQAGIRLIFFDSLNKQYQAKLDTILDAPLLGRFKVEKMDKQLIDAGLIEKCLEEIELFITKEPNEIDDNFRRPKERFYPFEAVRELLINALAHRDWIRFVDVEIFGYKDRLEIISPGSLPNSMTVEKMLAGQRSYRNSIIVDVLRDYGYVDAKGMGIRSKVIPALKKNKMEYEFESAEDYFKSTLIRNI